jgi:hypothetical protein
MADSGLPRCTLTSGFCTERIIYLIQLIAVFGSAWLHQNESLIREKCSLKTVHDCPFLPKTVIDIRQI